MKYVVIAGILIVLGFLVALHFIPIGKEPLSEVYFENHTQLPTIVFLNRTYNYTFSVHNLEYREMNYTYNITADYLGISSILDQGSFSLADNETRTISEYFNFGGSFQRAKIIVYVTKDTGEVIDIHFWVEEYASTIVFRAPNY